MSGRISWCTWARAVGQGQGGGLARHDAEGLAGQGHGCCAVKWDEATESEAGQLVVHKDRAPMRKIAKRRGEAD